MTRNETGSATLETVLLFPMIVMLLLLVVAGGRITSARNEVWVAARDGARAASLARTPAEAEQEANRIALSTLRDRQISCRGAEVNADTTDFRPGGTVSVSLRCTVGLGDVSLLEVPGSKTLTARSVAPIDPYRAVS